MVMHILFTTQIQTVDNFRVNFCGKALLRNYRNMNNLASKEAN